MKQRLYHLLIGILANSLIHSCAFAQAPQTFPYQAVARNVSGNLISNQAISLRISVLDLNSSGALLYRETHSVTTNGLGLFNINIGQGTVGLGSFAGINWASGAKYVKVEMDANGGSAYVVMGTSQLLSVPYAIYANTGGNLPNGTASNTTLRWNNSTSEWVADATLYNNGSNIGIGTTTPGAKLEVGGQVKITGGAPGAGKILTSDATGLATWNTPTTIGTTLDSAYDFGGRGQGRIINADSGAVKIQGQDGFQVTGTFGNGDDIDLSGSGIRMFFNPKKGAFRVGKVNGANWDKDSIGDYSVAAGIDNLATGINSTAMGGFSEARGTASVALGSFAIAKGTYSTALGRINTAAGASSTAMGTHTIANGYASLVIGMYNDTIVPPMVSTNIANPIFIIGNGDSATATSNAMVVRKDGKIGIGTNTPSAKLEVVGQVKITGGTPGAGKVLTSDATGLATWNIPSSIGTTLDSAYDFGGAGNGRIVNADNGAVRIQGYDGFQVIGAVDQGDSIDLSGSGTRMFFNPRKAAFRAGTVEGPYWNVEHVGLYSFATGKSTQSDGLYGFAAGNGTFASGIASSAFGQYTQAIGSYSTAIGSSTKANGVYSLASGSQSIANGSTSSAFGYSTQANGYASLVVGQFNDTIVDMETSIQPNTPLFIVGNGTDLLNRSNAMVVRNDGNVGINADLPKSKFVVNGAIGLKLSKENGAGPVTLDNTSSVWYFTNTASSIVLPAASTCINRIYTVVNATAVAKSISTFINFSGGSVTTVPASASIDLISDGTDWLKIR